MTRKQVEKVAERVLATLDGSGLTRGMVEYVVNWNAQESVELLNVAELRALAEAIAKGSEGR